MQHTPAAQSGMQGQGQGRVQGPQSLAPGKTHCQQHRRCGAARLWHCCGSSVGRAGARRCRLGGVGLLVVAGGVGGVGLGAVGSWWGWPSARVVDATSSVRVGYTLHPTPYIILSQDCRCHLLGRSRMGGVRLGGVG